MNFFSQNFEHLTTSDNFDRKTFLKATGLKETKLTGLIKGKSEPSVNQLVAIRRYFGITIDELIKKPLSEKATPSETIKFLVLDVDGVMTDGGMYYSEKGDDIKKFSTKDGMGIKKLCKQGFPVGIISASFSSKLVERRAKALGIQYIYIGQEPKLEILQDWCGKMGIDMKNVAYIGDDVNDAAIIQNVGFSACPADATDRVKAVAGIILNRNGGNGCVREYIDRFLAK